MEIETGAVTTENVIEVDQKIKNRVIIGPSITLLDIDPEKMKNLILKDTLTANVHMFITAQFARTSNVNVPKQMHVYRKCGVCIYVCIYTHIHTGFPGSSAGKESACNAGDPGSIPGSGRSAGEGIGYPFRYSWAFLWLSW